jgi:hypothetical protein
VEYLECLYSESRKELPWKEKKIEQTIDKKELPNHDKGWLGKTHS